ncbi:hypothetical protein AJ80_07258 [Polytolypa hystricis UAMH7299]|uniref:PrsW family intramembrane metalloprotease n=1 Tax=Polytolypa hystricis (strain UAMH7299) TaxID=1447883 RepID=A0A2B7XPT3_POLH7|nr:hypothetical protein AJ80_07258 [Polytolypa hystricis UAMH7299]
MSLDNTSLSLSARLLCYLGPPSAILLTYTASPRTALLSPIALLPTAILYKKWQKSNSTNPSRRGDLEVMVWTYAASGTLGLTLVALTQFAICTAATYLLFGNGQMRTDFLTELCRGSIDGLTADELARRAELAATWQNWVFSGVFTFVVTGLVEETLKYLPIAYARRRGIIKQRQRRNRAYIDYAISAALGFGFVEALGFLYIACENERQTGLKLGLTILERMVGFTGHLLVSALTGLRATRRDFYGGEEEKKMSWWAVTGPAILFHGAFNFVAISFSVLEGNVGWIHPTGVGNTVSMVGIAASLVGAAAWMVRGEWKALNERDRKPQ